MTFKKYDWSLVIRIALLFATMSGGALLLSKGLLLIMAVVLVVIVQQVIDLYRFTNKSKEELEQFVESVHYRDFSRHFDEKNAPVAVQPMRKGFNEINSTFKIISKERETQYKDIATERVYQFEEKYTKLSDDDFYTEFSDTFFYQ